MTAQREELSIDLSAIGDVELLPADFQSRTCAEVKSSNINVGFECLDRRMWYAEKAYDALSELGVKHARVQTGWGRCEEQKGVFDFTWLDEIVDKLLSLGVQPWFNVGYGNIHHTDAPAPDAVGWVPIYSEGAKKAWCVFVEKLTEHFKGRISHYEIWNEPEGASFWKGGKVSPKKYAELVAVSAEVIKSVQPDAKIVCGALASGTAPWGLEYLESCLVHGMGQYMDVLSYHVYRPRPEAQTEKQIKALRAILKRHGLPHVKLWQAECGCPSVPADTEAMSGIPWNELKQAKWCLRRILSDLDFELDLTTHFHMSDFHNYYKDGPVNKPAYFGLLRNETYTRKPAYYAFQSLCALFDSDTVLDHELTVEFDLDGRSSDDSHADKDWMLMKTAAFDRNGIPVFAYWYPADLNPGYVGEKPFEPGKIRIKLWRPEDGGKLEEPVVFDPISQKIYKICNYHLEAYNMRTESVNKGHYEYGDLPLLDYPLILTDLKTFTNFK